VHHVHRTAGALAAAVLLAASVLLTAAAVLAGAAAGPASASTVEAGTAPAAPRTILVTDEGEGEKVKYYVMRTSPDGEPEFLFQIAQRYLGNGQRYEEIFELNKGRTQPDGSSLTDPSAVLPGWVMQMPDDAEGEGIEFGVLPTAPRPPPRCRTTWSARPPRASPSTST
jgi:nucleoid-associated protein YgaU